MTTMSGRVANSTRGAIFCSRAQLFKGQNKESPPQAAGYLNEECNFFVKSQSQIGSTVECAVAGIAESFPAASHSR